MSSLRPAIFLGRTLRCVSFFPAKPVSVPAAAPVFLRPEGGRCGIYSLPLHAKPQADGTCERHSLGGSLLLDFRAGAAVHPLAAGSGVLLVRGADLPLGRGVAVSGSLRCRGRMRFPPRAEGTAGGLPVEPFPRRHVVFARHSLPQYRQRRGFDHPFHVSAGRGAGDDLLFPRAGIGAYFRRDRPVDRGGGAPLLGQCGFHAGRHPRGHDRRRGVGLLLCRLYRRRAPEPRRTDRLHGSAFSGWRFRPRPSRTWRSCRRSAGSVRR